MYRLSLAALLLSAAAVSAEDWPQWLGPTRDGVSTEKIAPWKSDPEVLWKRPVGESHSSPVVAGGKLFLHVKADGKEAETVLALDIKTGDPVWEKTYERGPFQTPFGNGPRATPAVDGERLFTLGGTGVLTAFATKDGAQLWQVDTLKEFGAKNLTFGVSASPLVVEGKVVVQVGAKGASVVAFDAESGKVAWKALDDPASYAAPAIRTFGGEKQIVVLTGKNLVGLTPEKGEVLWQFPFRDLLNESSTTPVMFGDVMLASSVTAGSVGMKRADKDGKLVTEQVWKAPILTCYFGTPVPFGKGQALLVTGTLIPPPSATLRCIDTSTGKQVWSKEKVGKYHATLLRLGDGNVLMLEEEGDLVLLDGKAGAYKELARSKVCGMSWAHPAISDGVLYVRDAKQMFALKMGK